MRAALRATGAVAFACWSALGLGGCCGPLLIPPFGLVKGDCGGVTMSLSSSPESPTVGERVEIKSQLATSHPGTPIGPSPSFSFTGPDTPLSLGVVGSRTSLSSSSSFFSFPAPGRYDVRASALTSLADSTPTYDGETYTSIAELGIDVRPPGSPPAGPGSSPENQPPVAAFAAPEAAEAGMPVTFDASSSHDPEGHPIASYRWDFGDGTPEVDAGMQPTQTHTFLAPGAYTVTLRVSDAAGASATTSRQIRIVGRAPDERPPSASTAVSGVAGARGRGRPFRARLTGVRLGPAPRLRSRGARRSLRGQRVRGRLRARLPGRRRSGDARLRALLRASWRGRLNASVDLARLTASNGGVAVARFRGPTRGRACVRFRIGQRGMRPPRGSLVVLGGTGPAATLRARANFTATMTRAETVLDGRIRVRRGRPRDLPRSCRALRP